MKEPVVVDEGVKVEHTAQEFADAYKVLEKEYGFSIVAQPVLIARDDGTFSLTIQYQVGQLPKQ